MRIPMKQIGVAALAVFFLSATGAIAQTTRSGQLTSNSSGQGMRGMSGQCGGSSHRSACGSSCRYGGGGGYGFGYRGTSTPLTSPYTAVVGQASPYASASANPYAGYGDGYGESEIAGAMRGTADIIASQGRWLTSLQQADLAKEQVLGARLQTRRQNFDEYFYERSHTPTFEEERERFAQTALERSLNDPPVSEIWSGEALNTLLAHLATQSKGDETGRSIPLDGDVLRHINLAAGRSKVGILKNEGRLSWPTVLREDKYKTERELLTALAPEAINQAVNGRLDAGTLKAMANSIERLRRELTSTISLTANQFVDANRFLAELDAGLKAMGRPDADRVLTGKYAAQGRTVAELIDYMIAQGLTFAPAITGDGAAYVALHRALVSYEAGQKVHVIAKP